MIKNILPNKALVALAMLSPVIFYAGLVLAIKSGFLWWGWGISIIFLISLFVRIKKEQSALLMAFHVSLAFCGAIFAGLILFVAGSEGWG